MSGPYIGRVAVETSVRRVITHEAVAFARLKLPIPDPVYVGRLKRATVGRVEEGSGSVEAGIPGRYP